MNKEELVKQSLQNSLRIAAETQNIAKHTESLLENQREQLQSIDRTLDDTKQSLKRSERIIKNIKSIGSAIKSKIFNYFVRHKNISENQLDNNKKITNKSFDKSIVIYNKENGIKIENKVNKEDEQLDQLTIIIKELKQSANNINKELCLQDKIIEDITIKTDDTSNRLNKNTKIINNIK